MAVASACLTVVRDNWISCSRVNQRMSDLNVRCKPLLTLSLTSVGKVHEPE